MATAIRVLAIIAVVFSVLLIVRRRRRVDVMHDRDALAKKFNMPPEEIVEIERPPSE